MEMNLHGGLGMNQATLSEVRHQTTVRGGMKPAHVQAYGRNGFLVYENALGAEEIDSLRSETVALCRGERGTIAGSPPAAPDESDDQLLERHLCIHFPHKASARMRDYLAHPAIVEVLTKVIGPNVKCMQSMLFIKSAGMPGQAWHQDEDYIPTRDRSLTGAWIALDDAHVDNGCLWVIPGSHRPGVLWPQQFQHDARFDCSAESYGYPYAASDEVPVEVTAGSIVFFNGYLLHRSLPNVTQSGYRRALVNHYMSAESLLPWFHQEGVHLAMQDTRDIVMVAGKDPYAYKGTTDQFRPHLRPSGKGGCMKGKEDDVT
jgi:ectoine hydroxylase-related dioxygenase (phytanoyl-CoA dioxygenase family)